MLMTDPAVPYLPGDSYGPYNRGTVDDIFLKSANGSQSLGLVWPGNLPLLLYSLSSPYLFPNPLSGVTVFPGTRF